MISFFYLSHLFPCHSWFTILRKPARERNVLNVFLYSMPVTCVLWLQFEHVCGRCCEISRVTWHIFGPLLSLWRLAEAAMACGAALRKPFSSILLLRHRLPLHRSLHTHRWHHVPSTRHDVRLSVALLHLTSSLSPSGVGIPFWTLN